MLIYIFIHIIPILCNIYLIFIIYLFKFNLETAVLFFRLSVCLFKIFLFLWVSERSSLQTCSYNNDINLDETHPDTQSLFETPDFETDCGRSEQERHLNDVAIVSVLLALSWGRSLSYRNQSIDVQSKVMDWFLYDRDLLHERVNFENIQHIMSCLVLTFNI